VVLDGGMGTQLQTYKLQEDDYRGKPYMTQSIFQAKFLKKW
jgi:methionine synthase I (cobalamin-dependent)